MQDLEVLLADERVRQADATPARLPIRSIAEIPSIRDFGASEVAYMQYPELPAGAVVALTGDSGCGKSTLACAWAGAIAEEGRSVLVLDRENPVAVVRERFERLGICDGPNFRYWGGWLHDDAAQPATPWIVEWVRSCNPPPLVIVDSFIAFFDGNENESSAVRLWINQCRKLADAGATVVLIHHTGKGDSSQDYRGSSDFKAAIDAGFVVSNFGPDGLLGTVRLRCFKSRFGFAGELKYQYVGGKFIPQDTGAPPELAEYRRLTDLLRQNPNVTGTKFDALVLHQQLGRNKARSWLNAGVLNETINRTKGGKNGWLYSLPAQGEADVL